MVSVNNSQVTIINQNEEFKEEFKQIIDFPNYEISNIGRVRNIKSRKILAQTLSINGYYYISLCNKIQKPKKYMCHRLVGQYFIPNPQNQKYLDHINQNKLDNYYKNLRWCTIQQNNYNTKKYQKQCSSKYKGVCWDKERKKWLACAKENNRFKFLGYFENEKQAARYYNEYIKNNRGEFGYLNEISDDEKQ